MKIPTEPIGSIPRTACLQEGMKAFAAGQITQPQLEKLIERSIKETKASSRRLGCQLSPMVNKHNPALQRTQYTALNTLPETE